MKRYNKGNMLCITVAVLALLSALSIMFMSTSSVERSVSSVAVQNCNAKLAAEAGLEYAISQLRKDFGGTRPITAIGTGSWWYQKQNTTINNNNSEQTGQELFDNAAAEIRLDALHKKQDSITNDVQVLAIPSYCAVENTEVEINNSESTPVDTVPENSPKNISGVCGNTDIKTFNPSIHFPFTLKIVDTTSQFPLNTHVSQNQMNQLMGLTDSNTNTYDDNAIEIVGSMLDCLSEEVAKLSAWQAYKPNDKKGPLHGLGKEIIRKRNKQTNSEGKCCGFLSKYDIVGKYTKCENASSDEITLEDLSYIWDYITVQPTWKEMAVQNIYRQIAPINGEAEYRIEYRCPVNINTASYPVLMAVLNGISSINNKEMTTLDLVAASLTGTSINNEITIDPTLAENIARNIIAVRSGKKIQNNAMTSENDSITFKTWTAFNYFIDVLSEINSSDKTLTDTTWGMIKANFNPNVHLKKTNPDLTIYQNVTKPELSKYTTEFCFFPLGYFEITSLGEQYDDKGNILSSYHIGTTAHIYNTLYQTSQYDFEGGASGYQTVSENFDTESVAYNPSSIASRISTVYTKAGNTVQSSNYGTGYNAFTLGNNIYKNSTEWENASKLLENASKLYGAITPVRYQLSNVSGNENINTDSSGNTLYTGSETLDNKDKKPYIPYVFQENFSGNSSKLNTDEAFPSPNSAGVVNHERGSCLFSDGLYLQPGISAQKYDISESNFPTINNDNPLDNQGTILFWFKINNKWYGHGNQYQTVFLSNQKQADITIQREIKFKVEKPTETDLQHADNAQTSSDDSNISSSTKQFLRKLTIEFVSRVTGDNLEESNYAYKETKRSVDFDPCKTLGIHVQEWYHLAVRWQDSKQETANNPQDNTIIESSINDKSHIVLCGNFYNAQDNLVRNNGSQLGRIYDTETNLVTSDTEKTLVTSTDTVTQNTTDKINGNCFFIGNPNSTLMLYMTIDDFRISALCENTIDDANYFPSRAPYPNPIKLSGENDPPVNCYAVYQGRMKLPNNIPTEQKSGSITSFAWTCYGDSSLRPHYITYAKEYEEIDYEKAFEEIFKGGRAGSEFNYKNVKNKRFVFHTTIKLKLSDGGNKIDRYKYSHFGTKPDSFNLMWYNTSSFTSEELVAIKEDSRIQKDLQRHLTEIQKEINLGHSLNGWRLVSFYKMEYNNIDDFITDYISKWDKEKLGLLQPKEKTTIEKFQTSSFIHDCIVPEKANDLPYIFKDEENNKIDSWVYEIVFPASTLESSNNNQVFNNAIIDDVTCFYLLDKPDISDRYAVH